MSNLLVCSQSPGNQNCTCERDCEISVQKFCRVINLLSIKPVRDRTGGISAIGLLNCSVRTSLSSVRTVKTGGADILPVRPLRLVNKMLLLSGQMVLM